MKKTAPPKKPAPARQRKLASFTLSAQEHHMLARLAIDAGATRSRMIGQLIRVAYHEAFDAPPEEQ
jgi:hypothetical protein